MSIVNLPRIVLLDGGMGRELRSRGVPISNALWSANALLVAPEVVRQIHLDYIFAGANIITTNTYGLIRANLAKEGIEDRFALLNRLACTLASDARERTGRAVSIAGSLPPLRGSYRPDLVGKFEEIYPLYREQAELLAPHVDLLLCETMSSAAEAKAAARAACQTGKPTWVSWTLHEDRSGNLRSEESIAEAFEAIADLPISGVLANCCPPESITQAMPALAETGIKYVGGYANTAQPIPRDLDPDESKRAVGPFQLRWDLEPENYAGHAATWLEKGATVVGGCCGTGPGHIAELRHLLDRR
uniref:Homocysteine/selenocysteine methylase (S-methylmethionine-dependent) n=1 Tax=Candidatus Kentrum sp. FM TaxID=2126340 RepID=A0A450W5L5_9GAMM|nr:MAG: Homocysteine/selenocysteine methylase (S-methylmethionine-dependent) [Candidatus Kentron sp. FM]VFJ60414.1 MAG: Homocysteine/selenocysteine methylase (S-methylmethionine-dependent) [Candidatus Kentron sp. FM]VFK12343.1 MAG: Homocysteine/selenocysteine methylase (S-methylmethionine-dependent) [Candidatus Kentron sp. FM]